MFDSFWKIPARLWRRRHPASQAEATPRAEELAHGSLEEMVRRAEQAASNDRQMLFIDCEGRDELLAWAQIDELRRAPSFPVEI